MSNVHPKTPLIYIAKDPISRGTVDYYTSRWIGQMTTPPTQTEAEIYLAFISDILAAGLWNKIDVGYLMCGHDAQAARINFKSPGEHPLTASGGVTFTKYTSYVGNGVDGALTSSYIPATHGRALTQNSAHGAINSLTSVDAPGGTFMLGVTGGSHSIRILPRAASNSDPSFIVNASSFTTPNINLGGDGFFVATRGDSSNQLLYRNGTQVASGAVASSGLGGGNVTVFRTFSSNYSEGSVNYASWGGYLTEAEAQDLEAAVDAAAASFTALI